MKGAEIGSVKLVVGGTMSECTRSGSGVLTHHVDSSFGPGQSCLQALSFCTPVTVSGSNCPSETEAPARLADTQLSILGSSLYRLRKSYQDNYFQVRKLIRGISRDSSLSVVATESLSNRNYSAFFGLSRRYSLYLSTK